MDPTTTHLVICLQERDGTIHLLHPDAPAMSPRTLCEKDLSHDARFVIRLKASVFVGDRGAAMPAPIPCPICLPRTDADRAQTLGERLKLFAAALSDENDTVAQEGLRQLRAYVEAGDYSQEDYDLVVKKLRAAQIPP